MLDVLTQTSDVCPVTVVRRVYLMLSMRLSTVLRGSELTPLLLYPPPASENGSYDSKSPLHLRRFSMITSATHQLEFRYLSRELGDEQYANKVSISKLSMTS